MTEWKDCKQGSHEPGPGCDDCRNAADKRPPKPEIVWDWFSICSKHILQYDPECKLCQSGRWVSKLEQELSNWLWTYSKRVWVKWANRDNPTGWVWWLRDQWSKYERKCGVKNDLR